MTGAIQQRVTGDMKAAMKAGDKDRLLLLRMLLSDLKNEQIRLNRDELTDEEEITVLRRASKVRKDEIDAGTAAGRAEVATRAEHELAWVESYLPQQMSAAEVEEKARALLAELGISSRKEQGRFMREWMSRYKAVSDGKVVNEVLARLLA